MLEKFTKEYKEENKVVKYIDCLRTDNSYYVVT